MIRMIYFSRKYGYHTEIPAVQIYVYFTISIQYRNRLLNDLTETETQRELKSTIFWDITPCSLLVTCFYAGFFLGLFFDPEDGGDMFLRNVG
jgi:hypothetical protein